MRVCIVTPYVTQQAIGGMQQHTDDLARGLVLTGHDVTIVSARVPVGSCGPPAGVTLEALDVDPPENVYDKRWGVASARAFRALHDHRPFDVIHSEGGGALGLVKHGITREVPSTVLFHGNWLGFVRAEARAARAFHPRWLGALKATRHVTEMSMTHFGQGHWRAYRDFESMVPSQAHLADTISSHRLDPARTHVVPNGIDVHEFRPGDDGGFRMSLGLPQPALVVMTLGRLAQDKGNDHALRAFALLDHPGSFLVCVGDGGEEPALRKLAVELGIADRVRFPGGVPQGSVPGALRAADVFWFPTVRDEAAPLVMPQAMATGLPIVASRLGGIPECVTPSGAEAILVPPGDPNEIARATIPLLTDPGRRRALGDAARRRAMSNYSLETMTERTLDVYRMAIERARR